MEEYYEEFTLEQVKAAEALFNVWEKAGMPETPFSKSGKIVMDAIFDVWELVMPQEYNEWVEARKEYQQAEKTIKEQVKQRTGRSLASYPPLVFTLIKKIFPNLKLDRQTHIRFAREYPLLRFANRI